MTLQEFINECLEDAKSRPKDMTLGQSVYRYIQKRNLFAFRRTMVQLEVTCYENSEFTYIWMQTAYYNLPKKYRQ